MYDPIAHYYDLTHADLTADIPYVLALAVQSGGPVLELGCGSGRLLLPLARAGHTVTGIDNSPAMLARARERLTAEPEAVRRRVTLVEGDMAKEAVDGRFALAILPYNTAMHLERPRLAAALQRVKGVLAENGRLFIDLANPFAVAQTPNDRMLTMEKSFTHPASGDLVLQLASNWLDEARQTLHITWIYDASPAAGGPVRRTVAEMLYHYLYPHEWELLLAETGFVLQQMLGDYEGSSFSEGSERLLLLARSSTK